MKKLLLAAILLPLALQLNAQAVIDGTTYQVDTLVHRQIGPGVMHTRVRVPDYPLNVYLLEMDMTNEYNRAETHQSQNLLGTQEKLADVYTRHKGYGKKPLAGCNASFWCVSSQSPYNQFMLGAPHGAEVVNDTLYENTNSKYIDAWNGGPEMTGSTIIDKNKVVHVGRHEWTGYFKSAKFSANEQITQVNKRCGSGQLAVFNVGKGRDKVFYTDNSDCDYIYLNFKEGEGWATAKDMTFVVAEIRLSTASQTLGDYDACVVADGNHKAEWEKLSVGDEVIMNHYWFDIDGDKSPIAVENMTEGNAYIMLNGELSARNTNESYCSMIYSRTAYGSNADGTKLYMIVIDNSIHPEYGRSGGCSTTVMLQLWKFLVPDLWNAVNYDAGGSAQMMVAGDVINKTTETTPRAVANAMIMFSTAPNEDNDVITSISFDAPKHEIPSYFTYAPTVLGYNKYGELISEDVKVTYTCSENVGSANADGSAIVASATSSYGTITASYNGIETTAPITVTASEMSIRIKPQILIDAAREYSIEVVTEFNDETLLIDPALLSWEVGDQDVASITDGVLKGLKEGSTTIKASVGDFSDETTVKVEIADAPRLDQSWDNWTITSSALASDATLSSDGVISFEYSGQRHASITLEKDITFYSLPDEIKLDFTTTTKLVSLVVDFPTGLNPESNELTIGSGYDAGSHSVDLLSMIEDPTDLAEYPITLKSIAFSPNAKGYTSGSNTITINGLYATYSNYVSGVENVLYNQHGFSIEPSAAHDGSFVINGADADSVNVAVYSISGIECYNSTIDIVGGTAKVYPNLAAGVYVVKASCGNDLIVNKMTIK